MAEPRVTKRLMSRRAPATGASPQPQAPSPAPVSTPPPPPPRNRLYITRAIPDAALELLQNALPNLKVAMNQFDRNLTRDEIIEFAEGANALICTLADPIDAALLKALARSLRVVATFAVGVNNIDLEVAHELRIAVTNTPGVLTEATAEIAVSLILACARRVVEADKLTRSGQFSGWAPLFMRGRSVFGSTVGVIGAGRIGSCVARAMRLGFDCKIVYHSPSTNAPLEAETGAKNVSLEQLLELSDFVSVHCPLKEETRHLIDAKALSCMKPTAFLINTSRGPVVDEVALVHALRSKRIAGAGLDVYEHEPNLSPGLLELDNVVLLPHIGSATLETRDRMGLMCAQSVIDALEGKELKYRVV